MDGFVMSETECSKFLGTVLSQRIEFDLFDLISDRHLIGSRQTEGLKSNVEDWVKPSTYLSRRDRWRPFTL